MHAKPNDSIGTGLILYDFTLEQPDPGLTSKSLATELDWYMDWTMNDNFTVSFVAAFASPGKAVEQEFNRTQDFWYGMVYFGYNY